MPKPYSEDLRKRVISKIDSAARISLVSRTFNVSRETIYNWLELRDKTGSLQHRTGYQRGHSHKIKDINQFIKFIECNKDKTMQELALSWSEKISAWTICKWINKLGYTYKKNLLSPKTKCKRS